jgi:hypothetical protein
VVAVRLDDADLVGPDVLIYAKLINVSDGGMGVVECRTRFDVEAGSVRAAPSRPDSSKSGGKYTRSFTCEVSVKVA